MHAISMHSLIPIKYFMKKIQFSKKYNWHFNIFPFQSIRQLMDTILISFVITFIFASIVDINYLQIFIMFLMAWFFSWSVCYMTLPGIISVEFENLTDDLNKIKKILLSQKYSNENVNAINLYKPKIPEFMIWRENIIKIHVDDKNIILTGPKFIMEIVAYKLIFQDQ